MQTHHRKSYSPPSLSYPIQFLTFHQYLPTQVQPLLCSHKDITFLVAEFYRTLFSVCNNKFYTWTVQSLNSMYVPHWTGVLLICKERQREGKGGGVNIP